MVRLRAAVFSVAGVVLVSKVLGFLREVIIADRAGTSADYDLYLIAIILPSLLYGILNYAGFYLLVPHFTRLLTGPDRLSDNAMRRLVPAVNLNLLVAIIVTLVTILLAPYVMRIWAADYGPVAFARVVFFSRVVAAIIVLGVMEAFLRACLNARQIFVYPAASYIVYNVVCISVIVLFWPRLGTGAIAASLVIGLAVQVIYLALRLLPWRPWRWFSLRLWDVDSPTLLATGGLLVGVELVNHSYFLIDRYFAPGFGEGVVSALAYCQVLVTLPDAVIGLAIGSVLFPILSQSAQSGDVDRFADLYRRAVAAALVLAIPLAVVYAVAAEDVVLVIFRRGAFNAESVKLTATALRPLAPSLAALFVISASIRAAYAWGQQRYVLALTVAMLALKWGATVVLAHAFGYRGITMASSVANLGFAVGLVALIGRMTPVHSGPLVGKLLRLLLAGLVSLAASAVLACYWPEWIVGTDWSMALLRLLCSGSAAVVVFIAAAVALGLRRELSDLIRFRYRASSQESI